MATGFVARHERCAAGSGGPAVSRVPLAALALLALALAAPALRSNDGAAGHTPTAVSDRSAAVARPHDRGRALFRASGCADCHTLAAAGTHGRIGPNLDRRFAGRRRAAVRRAVLRQLLRGGGGMPSFRLGLSRRELHALAAFVAHATAP
jgi:mono/diheme cytochrome c family protein